MTKYSINQVFELVQELLDHQRVLYYVNKFVLDLLLWRGSHSVTVAGRKWCLPVNSLCAFIMSITLVEKPWLLPSFSFLTFGWMLSSSMQWRHDHPNPWWRCHTLPELLRMLLLGKGVAPAKIEANERAEEAAKFDQTWRELIEDTEKKAASKALEVAREQEELTKELEDAGGANADIASKLGSGITLNPLQMAKRYLYPIQQMLLVACEWVRFAKNILLWEESYYSFWVTFLSFTLSVVFLFLPWVFIARWTARITAWALFGPWMKLVDMYIMKSIQNKEEAAEQEEAERKGRRKIMEKIILDTRIRNEIAFKLRDFKQYFFGKFLTKVPILKADRYVDIPLPSSTAEPVKRVRAPLSRTALEESVYSSAHRETGQHLVGLMIPKVQEVTPAIEERQVKKPEDSAPLASVKIGSAVCIAAIITYFLVPFLIHIVQSCTKYLFG